MRALVRFNNLAASAVRALVVAAVLVMLVVLAGQILLRYVFNFALTWSEELSIALLTWAVLLSVALGVKECFHVRLSLLIRRLPAAARLRAEQVIHFATAGVGVFLSCSGWRYFADTRGSVSAAMGYPNELVHIAALACGLLITLFALEAALEGRVPPDEGQG